MALTKLHQSLLEKARAAGAGEMGVSLSEDSCKFLLAIIVADLGLKEHFPELPESEFSLFEVAPECVVLPLDISLSGLFERLINLAPDSDTYFSCLAALHRSRLKYARILERQPIPTMDQVGPRSLLQFGTMRADALAAFLLWRKWIFDIDNRAGQETGYLFEPIIAHSIGGVPLSSRMSPIRRHDDTRKGRQVDCVRENHAYEIKIRVTIAASGQGRWREELDFPIDCRQSGYTPVLVVLDPTANPKLDALIRAFEREQGEIYVGKQAWAHLEDVGGEIMARFLEKYVRKPIEWVLRECPELLPDITLAMSEDDFTVSVSGSTYSFPRSPLGPEEVEASEDLMPEDIEDESPGV